MDCQHINRHIYNYCEGKVSPELRTSIEKHISSCKTCHNHYKLTLLENEVLQNPVDIPLLSPDFKNRVMNAITLQESPTYENQSLIIKKRRLNRIKKVHLPVGTAIVATLMLCLYISGINPFVHNTQIADNNTKVSQFQDKSQQPAGNTGVNINSKEKYSKDLTAGAPKNDSNANSSIRYSTTDSLNQIAETNQPAAVNSPDPIVQPSENSDSSTGAQRRFEALDVGRSNNAQSIIAAGTTSFAPQNIPPQFKFVGLNNTEDNKTVYNYVCEDKQEILNIEVSFSEEKSSQINSKGEGSPQATSDKIPPEQSDTPAMIRNINVNDKDLLVVFSGNLPPEELKNLADNTVFK